MACSLLKDEIARMNITLKDHYLKNVATFDLFLVLYYVIICLIFLVLEISFSMRESVKYEYL